MNGALVYFVIDIHKTFNIKKNITSWSNVIQRSKMDRDEL